MEVGGPFWTEDIKYNNNINKDYFKFGKDSIFVLSGRTAIDMAIQDILIEKKIKKVYFPSYCCMSMVDCFVKRNIEIVFYNVYFDNGLRYDIDLNMDCDVFFAMNYFGYTSTNMEYYINEFKKRKIYIIEDFTQNLLNNKPFCSNSDYVVASLRKWFPITTGGLLSKLNNKFNFNKNLLDENKEAATIKKQAMNEKKNYIEINEQNTTKDLKKISFQKKYAESNEKLKDDYINKKMDEDSLNIILNIDIENMKKKIKDNVVTIYNNLKNNNIKYLIKNYDKENDYPLYVPVYMEKEYLIELKKNIYRNEYYCPSHWPIDN